MSTGNQVLFTTHRKTALSLCYAIPASEDFSIEPKKGFRRAVLALNTGLLVFSCPTVSIRLSEPSTDAKDIDLTNTAADIVCNATFH